MKDVTAREVIKILAQRIQYLEETKADRTKEEMKRRNGENYQLKMGNPFIVVIIGDTEAEEMLNPT